jgi:polyisoprenoid-binding protein YceI
VRTAFLAATVLAVGIGPSLEAQTVAAAPFRRGELTFFTRVANGPDFTGRVSVASAAFTGNELNRLIGHVEVRAREMRTGIGLRDSHLRGTLHVDSFPTIRFELVLIEAAAARGDSTSVVFEGNLTLHGVTRTIRVPGSVVLRPDGADVLAHFPLDMREYGIAPPVRLFARVQPVIEVGVSLSFGP